MNYDIGKTALVKPVGNIFGNKEKEKTELEKQIESIEKDFDIKFDEAKVELPDGLELDPIEYKPKSDEELKADADNKLSDYYNDNINNINKDSEDMKNELEGGKGAAEKNKNEKTEYIETAYEAAKENSSNDVLKRGLARSTVATNTMTAYEDKKTQEKVEIAKDYADAVTSIDNELASLDSKREKALRDFDTSYAAKLAMTMGDLMKEREEKIEEATKYNNTIKEKENEYIIERLKTISELTGESYDNLKKKVEYYTETVGKLEEAKNKAKYDTFLKSLNSMTKAQALKELDNNPIYKDKLSADYYEKLKLSIVVRK